MTHAIYVLMDGRMVMSPNQKFNESIFFFKLEEHFKTNPMKIELLQQNLF